MKAPRFSVLLSVSAGVAVLDQIVKWIVAARLDELQRIVVMPFFDLVRWHNTGAAFGLLSGASGWQNWLFLVLGLVLVAFLGSMMRGASKDGDALWGLGLALMTGGAVGNLIDRVARGYVLDFISLHYGGWRFPAFNVADSAITVGVSLVLLYLIRQTRTTSN
ncbi:MAG: signal peptidase II [Gammaproteobacteria bacterium]|nr:signal peptidase II [Gammaproteobacteria bacterium]MYF59031.1 signal peptidase II [Gammaproteobacteria bacterium]